MTPILRLPRMPGEARPGRGRDCATLRKRTPTPGAQVSIGENQRCDRNKRTAGIILHFIVGGRLRNVATDRNALVKVRCGR